MLGTHRAQSWLREHGICQKPRHLAFSGTGVFMSQNPSLTDIQIVSHRKPPATRKRAFELPRRSKPTGQEPSPSHRLRRLPFSHFPGTPVHTTPTFPYLHLPTPCNRIQRVLGQQRPLPTIGGFGASVYNRLRRDALQHLKLMRFSAGHCNPVHPGLPRISDFDLLAE